MTDLHVGHPSPSSGVALQDTGPRRRLLLASVPSDSHMWNLVMLQLFMEEMGHEVINLGSCVPIDLLMRRCRADLPDCLVISTVNGHGYIDGVRVISALRSHPGLADQIAVIGGKFDVLGERNAALGSDLLAHGYDAVFPVTAGREADAMARFAEFVGALTARPV